MRVPFGFILLRMLRLVLTIWAAVTLVFVAVRLSGDPLSVLIPPDLPDDLIQQYRIRFGLDASLPVQYFRYLAGLASGDFGISFRTGGPAWDLVAERIPATLILAGSALALALALGVPAGIAAATWRGTAVDRVLMAGAVFGYAMPNFFLGILLILAFTLWLGWLPSGGFSGPASLIMPTLTLGLAAAGSYARFTRSALLEVMNAPWMRTARAKGLGWRRQVLVHALRATLVPLATLLGFTLGAMIGGAVVTETVFAWPGIGRLLVVSVAERDLAVVQLIVLLAAATMAVTNMIVDLLYGVLDPRIGTRRRQGL
jgi:peptide/nickel transport system permease protein